MFKRRIIFGDTASDKRLLAASIKALEDDILKVRFEYSIEYDDSTNKTTLFFWHRRKEGEQL